MGRAVTAFLTRANDSDRCDPVGWFECLGVIRFLLIQSCDREESVGSERIPQHLTVARLKNVQRHQCLGEKGGVG